MRRICIRNMEHREKSEMTIRRDRDWRQKVARSSEEALLKRIEPFLVSNLKLLLEKNKTMS